MPTNARAATVPSSAARIARRWRTIKGDQPRLSGQEEWTLVIDYSVAKIHDGAPSSAINMGMSSLHRHFVRMKVL
jgi:hypothetical protein